MAKQSIEQGKLKIHVKRFKPAFAAFSHCDKRVIASEESMVIAWKKEEKREMKRTRRSWWRLGGGGCLGRQDATVYRFNHGPFILLRSGRTLSQYS